MSENDNELTNSINSSEVVQPITTQFEEQQVPLVEEGKAPDVPIVPELKLSTEPPQQQPVVTNPLLQRARMPGEVHRLPSWGNFYTNGELDATVENGEVHIHPLTTIDEINIASPAKLYSGEGIVEAIKACIPSIKDPEMLLAQDVDFLLLCLRKVSYGSTFEFKKTHYDCSAIPEGSEPKEAIYQANLDKVIAASKILDIDNATKSYSLTLKGTGQIVKFEPLRYKDYIKLMQVQAQAARKETSEEIQKNIILDQLASVIKSVDEISERKFIREWLEVLNASHVRDIHDQIEKFANWGVNTSVKIKCRDCKEIMEVDLPTSPLILFS